MAPKLQKLQYLSLTLSKKDAIVFFALTLSDNSRWHISNWAQDFTVRLSTTVCPEKKTNIFL